MLLPPVSYVVFLITFVDVESSTFRSDPHMKNLTFVTPFEAERGWAFTFH